MDRIACHRYAARPSRLGGVPWRPAVAAMLCTGAVAAAVSAQTSPLGKAKVQITIGVGISERAPTEDIIAGEYIVTFGNGIAGPLLHDNPQAAALAAKAVLRSEAAEQRVEERRDESVVLYRYRTAIVGFAARLTDEALRDIRRVRGARIEPNRRVAAPRDGAKYESDVPPQPRIKLFLASLAPPPAPPFPKGLDRIDRRLHTAMDKAFQARFTGRGVYVYVIDTGVRALHDEFGSRVWAQQGHDATGDGQGTKDCGNHGTAVASVIGGRTLGVAPDVIIRPVRVFPCANTPSSIAVMTAGVDWVAADRVQKLAGSPVVANASFMTHKSPDNFGLNQAVENSIKLGRITYVIAAGNGRPPLNPTLSPNAIGMISGVDACGVSPANVPAAITVGNVKPENDRIVKDSNFGPCVDLFAPGLDILAASSLGVKATGHRDGTSFAAPHVAGVAALVLEKKPTASPADVRLAILTAANKSTTPNWPGIPNLLPNSGSPNVMLHWGCGSEDGVTDAPLLPKTAPSPSPCIVRR